MEFEVAGTEKSVEARPWKGTSCADGEESAESKHVLEPRAQTRSALTDRQQKSEEG